MFRLVISGKEFFDPTAKKPISNLRYFARSEKRVSDAAVRLRLCQQLPVVAVLQVAEIKIKRSINISGAEGVTFLPRRL